MESPELRKECVEEVLQSVRQKLLTKFASPAVASTAEVGSLSSIFQLSIPGLIRNLPQPCMLSKDCGFGVESRPAG